MFRYFALMWNSADQQSMDCVGVLKRRLLALSSQWHAVFLADGINVFCADCHDGTLEAHETANKTGVILGSLLEKVSTGGAPPGPPVLTPDVTRSIIMSRGKHLIDHYWGNYVAFLVDPIRRERVVLKDPTGSLPCYTTALSGVRLVFSCIADCVDLGVLRFSINESFLYDQLTGHTNPLNNAINEVRRIHSGECLVVGRDVSDDALTSRFLWNPLTFSESRDPIEDPQEAAELVRHTVRATTLALARGHKVLLHRLSGGLDSSIIMSCLKYASPSSKVIAYTYFNPHGRSDERPWARMSAKAAGCEHFDVAIDPANCSLAWIRHVQPAYEPASALHYALRTPMERQLTSQCGASAIFTGLGGDSGFCSDSTVFAVYEHLRRHGLGLRTWGLASRVALSRDQSTWSIATQSIRDWMVGPRPRDRRVIAEGSQLVTAELRHRMSDVQNPLHPWFHSSERRPASTIRRLGALTHYSAINEFYDSSADQADVGAETISPLYAQPTIEALLRIPVYTHFEGGRDRGLARRAFDGEVPQPILARLWKDRAPNFAGKLLDQNLDLLREFLLDGMLVSRNLLDRHAVERTLSPVQLKDTVRPGEVLRHLDTEVWLRSWAVNHAQRAAA